MDNKLKQFYNCKILRNHIIHIEDFWVRNGKIVNPGKIFFDEQIQPDIKIDCEGLTIAPGFIDLQINGGYGVDFSYDVDEIERGINIVAKGLLENGVTAFCPTIVTSPVPTYRKIIPKIRARQGNSEGASVLGIHAEGPFIDVGKKGAHPSHCIRDFSGGFKGVVSTYGSIENLKIVTLAPELLDSMEVIKQLVESGIIVSLGHSSCNLVQGEEAVRHGASFITHLFNAMLPFHHRDPGLVGLLTSEKIPKPIFYGIISDGIHTHPAALRIAYKTHPDGLILVTDAIAALGLNEGKYHLGQLDIVITDGKAFIAGTDTLCGSICNLNQCVQLFLKFTGCTPEYALEAASLHPAQVLGIDNQKGTLDFDADADFIMVDDLLFVHSTWISGECVYDIKTQSEENEIP